MSFVLFVVQGLAACTPTPTPTPIPIRIEATDLAAPLVFDLAGRYLNSDVTLLPSVVSLSTVKADLAAQKSDVALAVTRAPNFFATPMGYVTLTVVVNSLNPVAQLSAAQVQAIFAGQITVWGQVGATGVPSATLQGSSRVINAVSREPGSDAESAFESSLLLGASPNNNTLIAPTWDAMREVIGQDAQAIGFLPEGELRAGMKPVGVSARVLVVALSMSEPGGALRDFLAWAQGR